MKRKFALLVTVLALAGCQSMTTQGSNSQLEGVWQVKSINGKETLPTSIVTMDFSQVVSKVVGTTGCNQYSATINVSGKQVKLGQALMTKMACVPNIAQQEQLFLRSLASIANFKVISDQHITFYDHESKPRLTIKQLKSD